MFTNLFTATTVKSPEINIPQPTITPAMIIALSICSHAKISGRLSIRAYVAPPNITIANTPAQNPDTKPRQINGRIINHFVAPTNFMVLIRCLRENIARRTVLLSKINDMSNNPPPKQSSTV